MSINSALEVDLTGQVGAEELNGIPVSAIGGQPDLVRAAHRSNGGHAIIALLVQPRVGNLVELFPN